MKKLFQAVDIEKCIVLGKQGIASLIICSMLMIDVANAMEHEDDPRLLKVVQRTPSPTPPPDLRSIGSPSPEQSSSSSDGDSSPRSVSPPSSLPAPARDIIGSKPSSDDSASSGSSPEQSPPNGNQSLQIIPFPDLSQSSRQNITSVLPLSSSSRESQPEDFGTTPGAASFPDRVPALHVPSEKDRLLGSGKNSSYGSSHSSDNTSSDEDVGVGEVGHPQSSETAFGRFIKKFASTQPSQSSPDQKGTPGGIALRDNEILENGGNVFILGQGHHSIQSQGPEGEELAVDVDLVGDENAPPAPRSRFLPAWLSEWFSERPFWPEKPTYLLGKVEADETSISSLQEREGAEALRIVELTKTYFLDSLRSRQAHISSASSSDIDKGPSMVSRLQALFRFKRSPESEDRKDRSSSFSASSDSSSSDLSPHGLSASQQYVEPHPDSESEGDGQTVTLLPSDHLHRTMNYSSLRGMFHPSGVSGTLHQDHDEEFDPAAIVPYPGSPLPQTPWLQFLDGLDGETKAHLINFTNKVINGETSWAGFFGKWIVGPLIAVGYGIGQGPVFSGGLDFFADQVLAFKKFLDGTAGTNFIYYINISALIDAFGRDPFLYRDGFSYVFSQEKKEIGSICLATGAAFFVAFTPFAYLILSENVGREILQLPNWDNGFGVWVVSFGPPLFLDAFANAFKNAREAVPDLKGWFWQAREVFCPSSLPHQMRSPEETLRDTFGQKLINLKLFLVGASDALIEKIDNDIQEFLDSIHIPKDKKAAALLTYFLSTGDHVQKIAVKNSKKSIVEGAFEGLKYFGLIFGAPTTALLLQLVGSTVASLFTSNTVADSIGEGFALIAFLPFNYILSKYMNNFQELILNTDPRGHESHPMIRLPVKVFIGIQSLIYLFQTSVASLQSYNKWFGEGLWPFAAGIPFFIPKFMELVCNFNGTFNEQITTSVINLSHRIGGRCRGESLCTPCKKDKLIRMIENHRKSLGDWDPKSIQGLSEAIEFFK